MTITGEGPDCRSLTRTILRLQKGQSSDFAIINLRTELPAFYARFGFVQVGTAEMGDQHKLKQPCYRLSMSKPL